MGACMRHSVARKVDVIEAREVSREAKGTIGDDSSTRY